MENKIILGECLAEMRKLDDNCIDCVVTSPPYYDTNTEINYTKRADKMYDKFFVPFKEYAEDYFVELYRILKNDSMAFINLSYNFENTWKLPFELIAPALDYFKSRDLVIWEKPNPFVNGGKSMIHSYEFIFVLFKGNPEYNLEQGKCMKNIWRIRKADTQRVSDKLYHGAMFPIELPINCMLIGSKPNDIVLDTFMGTGQTAIACIRTDRKYLGIEINPKYVEVINERIEKENSQLFLFNKDSITNTKGG